MPPDPQVVDPVDVSDLIDWFRTVMYEADVVQLRGLGCRCPLRCEVDGARFRATPLNESVAATCTVDHARSYTT